MPRPSPIQIRDEAVRRLRVRADELTRPDQSALVVEITDAIEDLQGEAADADPGIAHMLAALMDLQVASA